MGLVLKNQVSKCFGCCFHRIVPLATSAASAECAACNQDGLWQQKMVS